MKLQKYHTVSTVSKSIGKLCKIDIPKYDHTNTRSP